MNEISPKEQLRKQHFLLMEECIQDAKVLAIKNGINQEDVIATLAAALFKGRISEKEDLVLV